MNSTESTSNNQYQCEKNKSEDDIEILPKRPEPKNNFIEPSSIYLQKNYMSNISDKNNYMGERLNSSYSIKSQQEYNNINSSLFPNFKNFIPIMPMWQFPSFGVFGSHLKEEKKQPLKLEHNFLLNNLQNEKEDFFQDKKENKNYPGLFNYQNIPEKSNKNFNFNENNNMKILNNKVQLIPPKLSIDMDSPKKNENINLNSGTKFFTNHNYGYKCSCSKTQCNRKYCECYNSGNYCVDCNCKNCNNKPPENSYTNKRPSDEQSKIKKEKVICTCTKSGCNKNYCECFKIGQKCSALCRCIGCENNDQIQIKKYNNNYQCNLANSIYIVKNKLYIEDVKKKEALNAVMVSTNIKCEFIGNNKKRKREENKYEEENGAKKIKKIEESEEVNLFNDSLFDKNGKVILRHINLIQI